MAIIKPTWKDITEKGDGSAILYTWTPVTEADTCQPIATPKHSDKSVHVYGTFGGATAALHGSNNDGTTFAALNTPASVAIAITADGIKAVLENTQQVKPVATGGAAQSLSVGLLVHFSNPARQ